MSTKSEKIDVRAVAHLARLELTDAETQEFQQEMSAILEYVEQISSLDLDNVEPTARAIETANVFRADANRPGIDREKVLANAPAVLDDELFKVPVVIDGGDA